MRWMKWAGLAAAILLIVSCFSTWVTIISKNIIVSGVDATGTSYGKPGYFNLLMTFFLSYVRWYRKFGRRELIYYLRV